MSRPLIGIPMHSNVNESGSSDHAERRGLVFLGGPNYINALELNGGAAVFIPLQLGDESLRDIYQQLDGLLLAGGEDLHPNEYGEEVESYCGHIDVMRDASELALARWALADQKPILAICRGAQVLNVAAGGSLYQDIESQHPDPIAHRWNREAMADRWHPVVVEPQSRLAHAFGATELLVNSAHHQALKAVPGHLRVTARASDQIVEAVEGTDEAFVLGVQFHPERMLEQEARAHGIFKDFVRACGEA
ncbi:MAG: gamma-glutamyl-gamma-aminobutyrate hydrolase family protein [Chloroflexota bacterium]